MKRDLKSLLKAKPKKADEDSLKKQAEELSKLNQDELLSELFKNADKAKQSGELGESQLTDFYSKVSPMLTEEQRERLSGLIDKLK